ncbi:MAG: serine/threonine-protein kinase [Endozoicomonas sp.]
MPGTTGITVSNPSKPRAEGKPSGFGTVAVTTSAGTFCGFPAGTYKGSVKSVTAGSTIGSASGWEREKTLDYFTIKPAPEPEVVPVSESTPFREQHISESPLAIHTPPAETATPQNKLPEPPEASKTEAARAAQCAREQGARLALTIPAKTKTEDDIRQAITRHLKLTPVPQGYIEEGSAGKVSRWTGENKEAYAVKIIENYQAPQHLTLYNGEVIGLLNIDHPNIVKVRHLAVSNHLTGIFSAITHPDEIPDNQKHLYQVNAVVSDFVNGWDISMIDSKASMGDPIAIDIQKHYPTGIETAIKLGIPLADALGYLHSKGITHRDIKPDNIIIDHKMNPRLVDFGFSKLLDEEQKTMTPCGTDGYMAPEIINNKPYNNAIDLWSLGSTLFTLTTEDFLDNLTPNGIQPLSTEDSGEKIESHTRITWFAKLDKTQKEKYLVKHYKVFKSDTSGLLHVIINLLDKNPEERMSASETSAALRDCNLNPEKG